MSLRIKDIMQRRSIASIRDTATLRELHKILADGRFSGLPVVDESGKVVGVVSQSDVVRLIAKDLEVRPGFYESAVTCEIAQRRELALDICEKPVSDIMETRIRFISPDAPVRAAAEMMRNLRIHRILVMNPDGELDGIVTAFDLLQVLENPAAYQEFYRVAAS